jgi:murein DD-endopeptidase MepM/ murein hydrolase activator NlpD
MAIFLLMVVTSFQSAKPCYANQFLLLDSSYSIIVPFGKSNLSSRKFHYGVDLKAYEGEIFHSPVQGLVIFKGFTPASSETITVRTKDNFCVSFLNLTNITFDIGDWVDYGDPLGIVTLNTNASTQTPHVHLSVRDTEGNYLDPALFINFLNNQLIKTENLSVPNQNQLPELPSQISSPKNIFTNTVLVSGSNLKTKPRLFKTVQAASRPITSVEAKPVSYVNLFNSKNSSKFESNIGKKTSNFTIKPSVFRRSNLLEDCLTNYLKQRELVSKNSKLESRYLNASISKTALSNIQEEKMLKSIGHAFERNSKFKGKDFDQETIPTTKTAFGILQAILLIVIIWRQSLLPAWTGGRFSPKGGESVARIRNNVYCPSSANP